MIFYDPEILIGEQEIISLFQNYPATFNPSIVIILVPVDYVYFSSGV